MRGLPIRCSRRGGLNGARPALARQERHQAAPRGPESEATGENPAGMKKTSRVVEGDNKGRGYELKRGSYVEIEPEELEAVEVVSTRAISCAGSGSSIS
jgi:hypothetical protein